MIKVLVCGGRDYQNREKLCAFLDEVHGRDQIEVLVNGAARGADTLAAEWADSHGIRVSSYPADWEMHGRSAGPIRNQKMLRAENPDLVIAFAGGSGTWDMIDRAEQAGIPVVRVS